MKLKELGEYFIGLTYKPENISDKGIIVLRSGNIQDGQFDLSDIVRVDTVIREKQFVKPGDILMCSRNGSARLVGKSTVIPVINEPMTFGAFMTIFRTPYNDYLKFFLQSSSFRKQLSGSKTTTINQITIRMLDNIDMDLPGHVERKKRIEKLETLQKIIGLRKKELGKLDDIIKARFVEMFGDLRINKKGWGLRSFDDLTVLITDGEHATPKRTSEGIYLLSARNILNHAIRLDDVDYIDQEEYDRIAKRVIPTEGDVLISCSGTVGRCCAVPADLKFQMVRSAALLRFKPEIKPKFAEYMITSDFIQEQINQSKTASSQANLFQGKIAKLKGFVPPIDMQEQFTDFISQVDKSKAQVQKSLNETQLLFDSLMQKYFG